MCVPVKSLRHDKILADRRRDGRTNLATGRASVMVNCACQNAISSSAEASDDTVPRRGCAVIISDNKGNYATLIILSVCVCIYVHVWTRKRRVSTDFLDGWDTCIGQGQNGQILSTLLRGSALARTRRNFEPISLSVCKHDVIPLDSWFILS